MGVELGKRLAEFRKRNQLSQEELANKLQVSRQSICNWESGDSSPSIEFVQEMAKIYQVSVDDLINTTKSVEDCYKENESKNKKEGSGPFVHVSKKGIFINDREDETFLSINKDGINISDGSSSNCDENYDFVNDNGKRKVVYSEKAKNKRIIKKVADLITGIMALIIAVIYVVLGIFIEGCWETMWPLFLTILIPEGLIKAIGLRKINRFPITWIALTTYFFLGTLLPNNQGWHPYWVILFIIPIFYAIAGSIIQINKEKKKNSYIDDDVTIEIDEEKDED